MPRFLHIFSMAGVAEMMCKYGAGDAVLQLDSLDPFGFAEHYGVTQRFEDVTSLINEAAAMADDYDHIIIHDFAEFAIHFTPSKVILIFHGSKLRSMSQADRDKYAKFPHYITTQDLWDQMPNATYLPNPVDLELFLDDKYEEIEPRTYLCINRSNNRKEIESTIRQRYPDIEYFERTSKEFVKYTDMPEYLVQYTDYVDWKFDYSHPPKTLPHPSCTGLQALALGLNVHDKDGLLLDRNLLIVHDAKRVTERFIKDYDTITRT